MPRAPPPGEGVICAWGIYTVLQSVGSTCFPGENPSYQADLKRTVEQFDAYVARNAKDWTPEKTAEFKRRQGHTESPAAALCQGDPVMMYRAFERYDPAKRRSDVDRLLARDGPPTWGTCL